VLYIEVHLLVFLINFMLLISAQNMEHIKLTRLTYIKNANFKLRIGVCFK